jgi:hypothetical protein
MKFGASFGLEVYGRAKRMLDELTWRQRRKLAVEPASGFDFRPQPSTSHASSQPSPTSEQNVNEKSIGWHSPTGYLFGCFALPFIGI